MKVNSPGDADVCRAIYEAAAEGVRIDLICRVRPGIAGLSETVSMHSVVGRFLEHSRIFYFGNGEWELPEWVPPLAADHRDSTLRARR